MSKTPNYRAMQVAAKREKTGVSWPRPGDTNIKAMTMGSWHASASNGGARRPRGSSSR